MKEIVGANLHEFVEPGSMGIVTETRYIKCYWPKLDEPTELFADGSGGLEIQGPPTPRNVIFPPDTKFLNVLSRDGRLTDIPTKSDCFFVRRMVTMDVEESEIVQKRVEVEPGMFRDVEYSKDKIKSKQVEILDTDITAPARAEKLSKDKK